jgi:hypothetical protein
MEKTTQFDHAKSSTSDAMGITEQRAEELFETTKKIVCERYDGKPARSAFMEEAITQCQTPEELVYLGYLLGLSVNSGVRVSLIRF